MDDRGDIDVTKCVIFFFFLVLFLTTLWLWLWVIMFAIVFRFLKEFEIEIIDIFNN